jgi:dihydropteroate synthase
MRSSLWKMAHGRTLELGGRSVLMGVLNVTPDSFSDGGRFFQPAEARAHAARLAEGGADIIDIGGESTRPGAAAVTAAEEQSRIMPLILSLAGGLSPSGGGPVISVDTYRSHTARMAVAAGAHVVNDVTGLTADPALADVVAETGAGLVVMHTGRGREKLADVIEDQLHFLGAAVERARRAGVADAQIVLDPGFGFAKETTDENLELMARFEALHQLGFPLLVGTSRKRFVGAVTGREADARDAGTAGTSVILRLKGAAIFRVHDVTINRDALLFADAMLARSH